MARIVRYTVVPKLPPELQDLTRIADNMWWCWEPEAIDLFFRMDRDLWVEANQDPRLVLGRVSQKRLEELAKDDSFLSHVERAAERLDRYMKADPNRWREKYPDAPEDFQVAYLSAEFGFHESISIYSGGLGLLAGDHMKAASDLGLPVVGVGLLYREGYFRQYLNADGWQQERYPRNDFYNMSLRQERGKDGNEIVIEVEYPEGMVKARVWRCQVGRVPIYLLDCDFEGNDEDAREITARLYGGDRDVRIRQEIMLGMGGIRALRALDIHATTYHMNEGHAAFMTLERVRDLIQREEGMTFNRAGEAVKAGSVFTTHTPVPAGNDMFSPDMVRHYFTKYCKDVGIAVDELLGLGRQNTADSREPFCMTVLALKLSAMANGVSELHGEVARNMWSRTWEGVPADEVPVTSITNGVHIPFWVSRDLAAVCDRYLGPAWSANPAEPGVWRRIRDVPDAELWRMHERRRERLVSFARRRLEANLRRRGAPSSEVENAREVLDPEVLTIGFARRFATYKRATLFLMDPERLIRILNNEEMPVQFIIAGKAHPQDSQAKELIREIIHFARHPDVRNRIIFIEDYDINVARYMVQGVDCWLNTPRRPMEASGTSGMKAAANGALNISVPDGWWCEAAELGENGWSIGRGESYADSNEQDVVESETLYEIIEKEAVPMFYKRGRDGLPREWVARMKETMETICPVFNTHRMVSEYASRFYVPLAIRRAGLKSNKRKRSLELSVWKEKIRKNWGRVAFRKVEAGATEDLVFGTSLPVVVELFLDSLTKEDIEVEIYFGDVNPSGAIPEGQTETMECTESLGKGLYRFEGAIQCGKTGLQALTVRAIPKHKDLAHKHETTLITWA